MAAPLSKMISIVSHSQTLHKIEQRSASHFAASSTANISSTTKSGFTSQQGAQWSPGDISTVVFGCLATVLGVMTLCFMLWLGRRTSRHETPDVEDVDQQRSNLHTTASDDSVTLADILSQEGTDAAFVEERDHTSKMTGASMDLATKKYDQSNLNDGASVAG
ncbi:hypothetical protein MMC28_001460 [Mycoblastus sanguinarius]|nr:hypothetical protein [Mycoblastus sanguinarius]